MPDFPTCTGKPEHFFGLPPTSAHFLECWGCRALVVAPSYEPGKARIYLRRRIEGPQKKVADGYVDFLHDRQSTRNPTNEDRITEEFRLALNGPRKKEEGILHEINQRGTRMREEERTEWQHVMDDGSRVTVELRKRGGYLYCGATRRRAPLGHRVMLELRKLNLDATYEHPGYVSIAVTPHLGWSFAAVNGVWEGDLVDAGQGEVHGHAVAWRWERNVVKTIPAGFEHEGADTIIACAIHDAITPRIQIRYGKDDYFARQGELSEIIAILGWTCINPERCRGLTDLDRQLIARFEDSELPVPLDKAGWLERHRVLNTEVVWASPLCELPAEQKARQQRERPTLNLTVTFADGDTIRTGFYGTPDEARAYYAIGKEFNVGSGPEDNMQKVTKLEIADS